MARLVARTFVNPLTTELAKPRRRALTLYWLGQAGFVIDTPDMRIVIDPYLSNSLEAKYRGTAFPHERMAPAPISPDELGTVSLVLCTHHHTDHLDGDTLAPLARRLPDLRFVVPAASVALAAQRIGVGVERLIAADVGQVISPLPGLTVHILRAAHETLEQDSEDHYRFLGYGLAIGEHGIFHSGDTIPFEGQDTEIISFSPNVALVPVNGRSQRLRDAGFAGNLTLDEAIGLTARCNIATMIAHHYGLFAFNTADPRDIDAAAASAPFQLLRAEFQTAFDSVLEASG